jgi:hypothetical protein
MRGILVWIGYLDFFKDLIKDGCSSIIDFISRLGGEVFSTFKWLPGEASVDLYFLL